MLMPPKTRSTSLPVFQSVSPGTEEEGVWQRWHAPPQRAVLCVGLTGFVHLQVVSLVDGCSCDKGLQSSAVVENVFL